jgi:carbamoyl-phosphate synthase large subunit
LRRPCRVLVTGAGSGVGQAIIKALRFSTLPVTIIGADVTAANAALYRADEAVIIPKVEHGNALSDVLAMLAQEKVDVVMVGSEFDLLFFSENKKTIEQQTNAFVVVAPLATVQVADDKWLTAEFFRQNGLPYAESWLPTDVIDALEIAGNCGYPVVLKARKGTSSRNVHIVTSREMLEQHYPSTPMPMLQRMIERPSAELSHEYTCSVFKTATGIVLGPIAARRTVRGGTSWLVEVAPFQALNELLLNIGEAVDFIGSLNIQLMLTDRGPVPFELNSRFSGTTAIRAHFGFNEPEMALKSFYYGEALPLPIIRSGVAMRYHEEVFIEGVSVSKLNPAVHQGIVNKWF